MWFRDGRASRRSMTSSRKPHWDLGPALGIINFDQGVKTHRLALLRAQRAGARLQRALIAWMLDLHIRQGYIEKYTPFMVKRRPCSPQASCPSLLKTFTMTLKRIYWMVPTAEVPLTGLHRG